MKVVFKSRKVNFREEVKAEGVGFENDFNSSARVSEDGLTWITAWSGFSYTSLEDKVREDRHGSNPGGRTIASYDIGPGCGFWKPLGDDETLYRYEGARNGFLAQDLLPDFGQVEVIYSSGSCPLEGKENLHRYTLDGVLTGIGGEMRNLFSEPVDGFSYEQKEEFQVYLAEAERIKEFLQTLRAERAEKARQEKEAEAAENVAQHARALRVLQIAWQIAGITGPHPSWEHSVGDTCPWLGQGREVEGISLQPKEHFSGCGQYVFDILENGKKVGEYFGGDRCNAADFHYLNVRLNEQEMREVKYEKIVPTPTAEPVPANG